MQNTFYQTNQYNKTNCTVSAGYTDDIIMTKYTNLIIYKAYGFLKHNLTNLVVLGVFRNAKQLSGMYTHIFRHSEFSTNQYMPNAMLSGNYTSKGFKKSNAFDDAFAACSKYAHVFTEQYSNVLSTQIATIKNILSETVLVSFEYDGQNVGIIERQNERILQRCSF